MIASAHIDEPVTGGERHKGPVHRLALALVWIAVASSAVVFTEPAPVDLLMMGLIVLLPVVGLTTIRRGHLAFLALWIVCGAAALAAATMAIETQRATIHTVVSIYLYLSAFILAAFVSRSPASHLRLVMSAYLWAAAIASALALIGYFNLVPGAAELFTLHGRAAGAFKDPNVFAPFLVPPVVYAIHRWLERPFRRILVAVVVLPVLGLALLVSFSRGAWMCLALSLAVYAYLAFTTAATDRARAKLLVLVAVAFTVAGGLLGAATQIDEISSLLSQRASLDQSYDQGPEGRFGGQSKAIEVIQDNPLGIGGREFGGRHHHEDPHNVYLSMLLNAGWLGGGAYLLIVLTTLILGLAHALRRTSTQGAFQVAFAAFVGLAALGLVIDTDHWRHFYVVLAIVWGLMLGDRRTVRNARILRIAGLPTMPATTHAAPRRDPRILCPARTSSAVILPFGKRGRRQREPRRAPRIIARHV